MKEPIVHVRGDGADPPADGLEIVIVKGDGTSVSCPLTPQKAASLIHHLAAWLKRQV